MTDDKTLHLYKSIYIFSGGKKRGKFPQKQKERKLKKEIKYNKTGSYCAPLGSYIAAYSNQP